jgi:hypothetical protein
LRVENKLYAYRQSYWRKLRALRSALAHKRVSSRIYTLRVRALNDQHRAYMHRRALNIHRYTINKITRAHRNRIDSFKFRYRKKRITLAKRNALIRRYTRYYNWDVRSRRTWMRRRTTYYNRRRRNIHNYWAKRISAATYRARVHANRLFFRRHHRIFRRTRFRFLQSWRLTHFRLTVRSYRKHLRTRRWSRAQYNAMYNCLRKMYIMRRNSYIRWHRQATHYYNTQWRNYDLFIFKRRNRATYVRVSANMIKYYKRNHAIHVRIIRILSKSCMKKMPKFKKPAARRVRKVRRLRKPRRIRKVRRISRRTSTTTTIRTHYRTVLDKARSSVVNYSMTIKSNFAKFAVVDQVLIKRCLKFF